MVAWMRSIRNGNSKESIQWAQPARTGVEDLACEVPAIACSVQRQLEGPGGLHAEAQTGGALSPCLLVGIKS